MGHLVFSTVGHTKALFLTASDGWECSADNGHLSMASFWLGLELPPFV